MDLPLQLIRMIHALLFYAVVIMIGYWFLLLYLFLRIDWIIPVAIILQIEVIMRHLYLILKKELRYRSYFDQLIYNC